MKIDTGSNNLVCGLTTEKKVLCWGLDVGGALGSPSTETCTRRDGLQLPCATTPQLISSDERFQDVSAGSSFACAVTVPGEGLCWGRNSQGQLGSPTTEEQCAQGNFSGGACSSTPTLVSGSHSFVAVAAGLTHACGVTTDGNAYCWGANMFGARGNGSLGVSSSVPELVLGGLAFASVSAGDLHSCGETTDGQLYCWGLNDRGQLGTGNLNIGLSPLAVVEVR